MKEVWKGNFKQFERKKIKLEENVEERKFKEEEKLKELLKKKTMSKNQRRIIKL